MYSRFTGNKPACGFREMVVSSTVLGWYLKNVFVIASVWWYQIPEIISDKTQRLRFQYPLYFSSFVVIFSNESSVPYRH